MRRRHRNPCSFRSLGRTCFDAGMMETMLNLGLNDRTPQTLPQSIARGSLRSLSSFIYVSEVVRTCRERFRASDKGAPHDDCAKIDSG